MAGRPVLFELADDGVARVRLNRADAANGLNLELLTTLHETLVRCHADSRVRALLLSGAGRNFCAGGDVREFAAQGEALPAHLRIATHHLQACAAALLALDAPVVAAVQGYAAGGGGLGLVCASDLVVAAESARFMLGATRVGMAPDAGLSVTLARLIGQRRALELALSDRELSATEALELGLVTRVVADGELEVAALALARELAGRPARAMAETKRLMWAGVDRSVVDALADEARAVSELSGRPDARKALAAVIKRQR
jgi:2-(1,2-epoxy-1,2-dihydrophenyl)acetyl-CoA isomerase